MPVLIPDIKSFSKKKDRRRRAKPVREPRTIRSKYRKELESVYDSVKIKPSEFKGLSYMDILEYLDFMKKNFNEKFGSQIDDAAHHYVESVSSYSKSRLEKSIAESMGVDFTYIYDDEAIRKKIDDAIAVNADLIKSVGEEYIDKVKDAVLKNYYGDLDGSLEDRIRTLGGITKRRAKFIARDQTIKLSSSITKARSEELGMNQYIWRTVRDNRVVGTPGGLWGPSEAHGDHYKREGKVFSYDDPPEDGAPGEAPGCRCFAEPIIDIDKLKVL